MLTLVKHTFDDGRNEKCCRQDRKNVFASDKGVLKKKAVEGGVVFETFHSRSLQSDHSQWTDISIHRLFCRRSNIHLERALEVDSFEQRLQDVNKFSRERFHCWCCQEDDEDRKTLMRGACAGTSEIYFRRINNLPRLVYRVEKRLAHFCVGRLPRRQLQNNFLNEITTFAFGKWKTSDCF